MGNNNLFDGNDGNNGKKFFHKSSKQQPDIGKAITDMLVNAFANGMAKGLNNETDEEIVEEQPFFIGEDNDTGLLPIVLFNQNESIEKLAIVYVNVGSRSSDVAMKYLRNFHLAFTAILSKLNSGAAFVFVPVREGCTRTQVIDLI